MNLFLALAVLEWTPGETQVSSCNVTKHCYIAMLVLCVERVLFFSSVRQYQYQYQYLPNSFPPTHTYTHIHIHTYTHTGTSNGFVPQRTFLGDVGQGVRDLFIMLIELI